MLASYYRYFFSVIVWLSLSSLSGIGHAESQDNKSEAFDHSMFSLLLSTHVKNIGNASTAQVDYLGFRQELDLLETYVASLSDVSRDTFDEWPESEQLAFLINAYNAWTIKLILTEYGDIESIRCLGNLFKSPWKKSFISLFGEKISLDTIEYTYIRESDRYNDPRIHFALNCATISCPALMDTAYEGSELEAQFEQQTIRFLSDTDYNHIENNKLKLSKVFKWSKKDFSKGWKGYNSLEDFLIHYADALRLSDEHIQKLKEKDMPIKYLKYNWDLNDVSLDNDH